MRRLLVSLCVCSLSIAPAAARMYQWRSPDTGTTQLSGAPPAWYRGDEGGPRVFVFDANQLVDDTAIAVSEAQRQLLRAAAFNEAPVTPPAPSMATPAPVANAEAHPADTGSSSNSDRAAEGEVGDKAAALKALIDAWDQGQVDQARALLDALPAGESAEPPN